jgi:hypothetical protein
LTIHISFDVSYEKYFKLDTSQTNLISTPTFPCQAIVLYDFEGTNEDEMSVRKDDKIFIESKPDYDGWLIAKGRERSGLVPEAYVQLISSIVVPVEQGLSLIFSSKSIFYLYRTSKKQWFWNSAR